MHQGIAIISFFFVGLCVKYIDAAYDDGTFSRKIAMFVAPTVGITLGLTMADNHTLLVLASSIILGVFITGKLDTFPIRLLVSTTVATVVITSSGIPLLSPTDWYIFLAFGIGSVVDEVGNDLADAGRLHGVAAFFFLNRGCLKFVALVFIALRYLDLVTAAAFLGFDLGYFIVSRASLLRMRHSTPALRGVQSNT